MLHGHHNHASSFFPHMCHLSYPRVSDPHRSSQILGISWYKKSWFFSWSLIGVYWNRSTNQKMQIISECFRTVYSHVSLTRIAQTLYYSSLFFFLSLHYICSLQWCNDMCIKRGMHSSMRDLPLPCSITTFEWIRSFICTI